MAPKESGKGSSAMGQSAEDTTYTGKADSYVPTFSGRQADYREFRKRCDIYSAKMKIAKRQSETVFNIVTLLAGRAWDVVEDLTVEELSAPDSYDKVFGRLDATFKYEPITELPSDFESFFIGLQRRGGQTVQEYQTEFMRVERRLTNTHKIQLPEKVRAWWFLRRSGLSKEQRQLVLTQLGESNLNLDRTMKAMNFIIGQDTKLDHTQSRWSKSSYKDPAYVAQDDDEDWPEDDDAWYGEDESEEPADWGEDYYDGGGPGDEVESQVPVYNVDEFDNVYATYMEAKSQLNQMRTSRGFYPVVAMVQGPQTERFGGGKKGFQKGKHRGKGKFSGKSRSGPPQKGSAKSHGQAAFSSSSTAGGKKTCLRCGSYGHLAKNCPQPSGTKRKIEQSGDGDNPINMVENQSDEMRVDENDGDSEGEDLAVQDGGAASALGSLRQIRKYLRFLVEHGVDINNEVEVFRCKKGFKYGNSHRELTDRCCLVPTFLGGEKQKVLHVVNGGAPILFGRPLLEQFGIVVDYHEKKMKYANGLWHPISKGEKGEYLIHLGESIGQAKDQPVSKIFMPEDFKDHIDVANKLPLTTLTQDAELQIFNLDDTDGNLIQNDSQTGADTGSDLHVAQGNVEDATLDHMHFSGVPVTKNETVNGRPHVTFEEPKEPANEIVTEVVTNEVSQNSAVSQNSKFLIPGTVRKLPPRGLRGMIYEAQLHVKQCKQMRAEAQCPGSRPRMVWEVYAGRGRVSDEVEKQGGISEKFGLQQGWDFSRPTDRKKFIKRLVKEQPDELMISPECRLWSPLQELTASKSEGARQFLVECRKHHHDDHLCFCAVIYEIQRRNGHHATIEHPWNSRAWKTVSFSKLKGFETYIDQCELGLRLQDDNGVVNPVRKPTCLFTTKKILFDYMSKFVCSKSHQHTPLEGHIRGQGRRSKLAENYPPKMAAEIARCLLRGEETEEDFVAAAEGDQEMDEQEEEQVQERMPLSEEERRNKEMVRANRELKRQVGPRPVDYVARLHRNLGHPSPETLVRMLEEVQATENVITAAKHFVCTHCYHRAKPPQVPPASGISSTVFNNRLVVDSAWIQLENKTRQCILTVCDEATRYIAVRILQNERASEFIKGMERCWLRHFGVPKYLRVDSAKGWESRTVRDWCSDKGIILEVAPAESHNWLGVVERRHQVVRKSLELYMDELGSPTLHNLKEAAIYVPPRINQMSFTKGFSPYQWVIGKTPAQELSLTAELFNPGAGADERQAFAEVQERRLKASVAFLKADTDAKLRRAMNQKFYQLKDQVVIGQRVWYWRVQGSGHLTKSKWRGPARCVAIEKSEDEGIWLTHGSSLLRCSPNHVRPMVDETRMATPANPEEALKALEELRVRSTTQYRDLAGDQDIDEPVLEDIFDPEDDPQLDQPQDDAMSDFSYDPPSPLSATGEGVPGMVQLMIPGLRGEDAGDRERTPRRRAASVASTEVPETPLEDPPYLREAHEPPGDRETSPTKKACIDDEVAASPSSAAELVPVPEEAEEDEFMVDDVLLVDPGPRVLPEGWRVVEGNLELDEIWVIQNGLRKGEINVRQCTPEEREKVLEGKKKELESFFKNCVWQFAEAVDQKKKSRIITARWVLTWKTGSDDSPVAKARLVLRGFQDPDLFTLDKASPTAARLGKMTLLALAAVLNWTILCGDVKAAFLSGVEFDREILVQLPKDCGPLLGCGGNNPVLMKMLKSAYGLADATLLWFREATRRLQALGWTPQLLDKCTFGYYNPKTKVLDGILVLHVDDMLLAGDVTGEFGKVVTELRKNFEFGKWETVTEKTTVTYCGGLLEKVNDGVTLSFEQYLRKILPMTVKKDRDPKVELSPFEKTKCRGLLGALQWPGGQGVPSLTASTSIIASELAGGNGESMLALNKTLRFAKETSKYPLKFSKFTDGFKDLCLLCFCDAAFGVRKDLASQGGFLVMLTDKSVLHGKKVKYSILSWKSFKLPRVCRSSLSAESQAMAGALEEVLMVKLFLKMLMNPGLSVQRAQTSLDMPCAVITDCKALYDTIRRENIQTSLDKRVAIEVLVIRDMLKQVRADLRWVSSERQFADGLTKVGSRQDMVDTLKGGYVQLVQDDSFQASKKKTAEQRMQSRLSTSSRVAMAACALVTAESLKGASTQGSSTSWFVMVGFFSVLVITVFQLVWWWVARSGNSPSQQVASSQTEQKQMINVEVQTNIDFRDAQFLDNMNQIELDLWRQSEDIANLQEENERLRRSRDDHWDNEIQAQSGWDRELIRRLGCDNRITELEDQLRALEAEPYAEPPAEHESDEGFETASARRRRYLQDSLSECSDPEFWMEVRH